MFGYGVTTASIEVIAEGDRGCCSVPGDALGPFGSSITATLEEPTPEPPFSFPSGARQDPFRQPNETGQPQWHGQAQAGAHSGQDSLRQPSAASGQEAAGWYDQGTASQLHAAQDPPYPAQGTENTSQHPQAQHQWSSALQAPQVGICPLQHLYIM